MYKNKKEYTVIICNDFWLNNLQIIASLSVLVVSLYLYYK